MRVIGIWLPVISCYQPAPSDFPLQDRELLLRVLVLMRAVQIDPIEIEIPEPLQASDIVVDVKDCNVPSVETSYDPLGVFECVPRSQPSELGVRSPVGVVVAVEKPPRIYQMKLFGL